MKKILVYSALALLCGAAILRFLQYDSGYVLIVAGERAIEMRLGFAVFIFLLLGVAWVFGLKGFKLLWGSVQSMVSHRVKRRQNRLDSAALEGLHLLIQQDHASAQKQFLRAAKLSKGDSWHQLAAAYCALADGYLDQTLLHIEKLESTGEADALTLVLLKADVAIAQNQFEASLVFLNNAKSLAPKSTAVLLRLMRVYQSMGDWHALETLLPELEKSKVLSSTELVSLKEDVAYKRLGVFGVELDNTEPTKRSDVRPAIDACWQSLPKPVKQSPHFVERYCHLLVLLGAETEVEALIRTVLKDGWHSKLVALYGALQHVDAKRQLNQLEHWRETHADDSELERALGRVCLRSELWGKAKGHFLRSLELSPLAETYVELARLLAQLGEKDKSLEAYKEGLLHIAERGEA